MKKLLFALLSVFLFSCKRYPDGTSAFAEGLWVIPTIFALATCFFSYLTYASWKKGGTRGWEYINNKWVITEDDKKFPIWKASYFVYAVACLIATIVVIIVVNSQV